MKKVRKLVLDVLDFFYPYFSKFIGKQTFRYLVSGGTNAAVNLLVFSAGYHFIFEATIVHIAGYAITRYIAAYLLALSISFPIGFLLNRYIVFQESDLKGRIQLFRYGSMTIISIYLDYTLLHLLIGRWGLWATASQAFIIVILSLFSYFAQTYFSFRTTSKRKT